MNVFVKMSVGAALFSAMVGATVAGGVSGRTVEIGVDGWGNPQLKAFYNVRYNPDTSADVWVYANNSSSSVGFNARNDPDYFNCYLLPSDAEYNRALDIANSATNGSFLVVSADENGKCINITHRTSSAFLD